jgi:O-6-methylguanine DNA methyltransferase
MEKTFTQKVYDVVAKIPKGGTMTYKEVAIKIGMPGACRAVGNALGKNTDTKKVPCHRVIRSDGGMGGYAWGVKKKIALLKKEGALQ